MLSIRMTRMGSKKKPYFRVVLSEARSGLLGDVVENLGTYNPRSKPAQVNIDKARIEYWLTKGARPSDSVRTLLARHLTRDLGAKAEAPAASPEA
jgi:small subunit ribosomal protein S16